jgi:hypothetical protein
MFQRRQQCRVQVLAQLHHHNNKHPTPHQVKDEDEDEGEEGVLEDETAADNQGQIPVGVEASLHRTERRAQFSKEIPTA